MINNFQDKANFIWQVADDVLRGAFKAHEYRDVILAWANEDADPSLIPAAIQTGKVWYPKSAGGFTPRPRRLRATVLPTKVNAGAYPYDMHSLKTLSMPQLQVQLFLSVSVARSALDHNSKIFRTKGIICKLVSINSNKYE